MKRYISRYITPMWRRRITGFGALCAALLTATVSARGADLLVFAPSSTTDVLTEINRAFEKVQSDVKVRASFGSSGVLARQVENGAPADVFISANVAWMDHLLSRDLIVEDTRRDVVGNGLVVIAPSDSDVQMPSISEADFPGLIGKTRLAIADPEVTPAGIYAKQALTTMAQWAKVENLTARTKNVRQALTLVERGEAALGVVYASDAQKSKKVQVVAIFPVGSYTPVVYQAALVKGRATPAARLYLEFLASRTALRLFVDQGFERFRTSP